MKNPLDNTYKICHRNFSFTVLLVLPNSAVYTHIKKDVKKGSCRRRTILGSLKTIQWMVLKSS